VQSPRSGRPRSSAGLLLARWRGGTPVRVR
jgi:hypothetical protein